MPGYLIEWNLEGRLALAVGLGGVGLRRVLGLLEAGARVLAIDPAASRPGFEAPAGAEVIAGRYESRHLDGPERPALVLACATEEVNRAVVADARERGIPVGSATEPGSADFSVPAAWRSGGLLVGVSTTGASPALARVVRDQIAGHLGPAPGELAALLAELRPEVFRRVADPDARRRLLASWADPGWLEMVAGQGPEAARRALAREIERVAVAGPGCSVDQHG
jgi:siroheme synthase-like protein